MPWFRIEDSFHAHPKVKRAGNAATGLWVRCGTWSAAYLTDGFISDETVAEFGTRRERDALLTSRLWTPADGGVVMPDYLDYNPSAEHVRLTRKRDAERKRRGTNAVDRDGVTGQWASRGREDPFP